MKTIQISDELYDKLKSFVVDPFDDTPESVIGRLLDITDKAKSKWIAWEDDAEEKEQQPASRNGKNHRSKNSNGEKSESKEELSYL
jgi:predicted CopG family antitoxin